MTRFSLFPLFAAGALALTAAPAMSADPVAPVMVRLSTGSELATWPVKPETPSHQTPILYLHGGPGMYTEARRFAEGKPLRDAGFTTIYYDQAGGGQSKPLPAGDYSIDRAVADLEALRIALGQERLILWGNSFGASLATLYATRYPNRVAGLILTSPGGFPGTKAKRNYALTNRDKVKLSKELDSAVSKIDGKGAAADITQADAGRLFDAAVAAELIEAMVCKGTNISPPKPEGGGNLFANRMISKSLSKLAFKPNPVPAMPVLILRGSCDFILEDNAQTYARFFGSKVTTIAGTGHGFLENRAEIESALSNFAAGALATVN